MKNIISVLFLFCCILQSQSQTWQKVQNIYGGHTADIECTQNRVFCSSDGSVYYTDVNNINWTLLDSLKFPYSQAPFTIFTSGNMICVGNNIDDSISISFDEGNTWPITVSSPSIQLYDNNLFYAFVPGTGLSTSADTCQTWNLLSTQLNSLQPIEIKKTGSTMYAACYASIYKSIDGGVNWQSSSNGLVCLSPSTILVSGNTLFVGSENGIFKSVDDAANWNSFNTGMPVLNNSFIFLDGDTLISYYNGVYVTDTAVANFTKVHPAFLKFDQYAYLKRVGNRLFAGGEAGVYFKDDDSTSWNNGNNGIEPLYGDAIEQSGSNILFSAFNSIFVSTDGGASAFPVIAANDVLSFRNISATELIACTQEKLYTSTDNGLTWDISYDSTTFSIWDITKTSTGYFIGSPSGVYFSSDSLQSWTQVNNQLWVKNIESMNGNIIVAATDGIYTSTDNGVTFTSTALAGESIFGVRKNGTQLIASGISSGVVTSVDDGLTWQFLSNPSPPSNSAFTSNGTAIYTDDSFTNDQGQTPWLPVSHPFSTSFYSVGLSNNFLFGSTYNYGFWRISISSLLGMPDFSKDQKVVVAPNPASGNVSVKFASDHFYPDAIFSIKNTLGQEVKSFNLPATSNNCSLSGLSRGFYLYQVYNSDRIMTSGKLIIE